MCVLRANEQTHDVNRCILNAINFSRGGGLVEALCNHIQIKFNIKCVNVECWLLSVLCHIKREQISRDANKCVFIYNTFSYRTIPYMCHMYLHFALLFYIFLHPANACISAVIIHYASPLINEAWQINQRI